MKSGCFQSDVRAMAVALWRSVIGEMMAAMRTGALIMALGLMACTKTGTTPGPDHGTPPDVAPVHGAAPQPALHIASEPPMRLVEVSHGVIAVLQPTPRRFADGNAVMVVTTDGIAIIDGPQKLTAVDWLRTQGESKTEGTRRVLVTTHWHLDHSLGGSFLRTRFEDQGLSVEHYGHAQLAPLLAEDGEQQRQELIEALPPLLERGAAMQASGARADGTTLTDAERAELDEQLAELTVRFEAIEQTTLLPPTHAVQEKTTLDLGGVTMELLPIRGHTEADLVVYLPQSKVLITGDVVDELPYGGHGRPRSWVQALRRLAVLEVQTVIPGHGDVLGPEAIEQAIALWDALLEQSLLAIQRGETAEQRYAEWHKTEPYAVLRAAMVTDDASERAFDRFVPDGLARAMADLNGEL